MSKLFKGLVSEGVFEKWASLLDWLFDDDRFSSDRGWSSGYVGAFIKKVKRLPNWGDSSYAYDFAQKINFEKYKADGLTIVHARGDAESRDLVRHIRNGIAHGKTRLSKPNGELFIEILDYGKKKEQTAYMFMPLSCLFSIYEIYLQIEKVKNGNIKKKGRQQ